MKALLLIALLFAAGGSLAEPDSRLAGLEAAYNRVHLEQQASYQQFLMIQELRRNEMQEDPPNQVRGYPNMGTATTRSLDYDENVRLQRARQERLQRYERDMVQAYARFLELGNQKNSILDQILALTRTEKR